MFNAPYKNELIISVTVAFFRESGMWLIESDLLLLMLLMEEGQVESA